MQSPQFWCPYSEVSHSHSLSVLLQESFNICAISIYSTLNSGGNRQITHAGENIWVVKQSNITHLKTHITQAAMLTLLSIKPSVLEFRLIAKHQNCYFNEKFTFTDVWQHKNPDYNTMPCHSALHNHRHSSGLLVMKDMVMQARKKCDTPILSNLKKKTIKKEKMSHLLWQNMHVCHFSSPSLSETNCKTECFTGQKCKQNTATKMQNHNVI